MPKGAAETVLPAQVDATDEAASDADAGDGSHDDDDDCVAGKLNGCCQLKCECVRWYVTIFFFANYLYKFIFIFIIYG